MTAETQYEITKKKKIPYCKFCCVELSQLSTDREKFKDYELSRNYGITYPEYLEMLNNQEGGCAICKKPPTGYRLAVDHKHEKNDKQRSSKDRRSSVRGLLCWACNAALGKFKDSPEMLRAAAEYLDNPPARAVLDKDKT